MILMKKTDLAYAAGIIDGEGCIGIWKRKLKQNGKEYPYRSLSVSVAMTEQWVPTWLQFAFGGSVIYFKAKQENHNPYWQWNITSNKALEFLRLILPYLKIKRPHAELGISFQSSAFRGSCRKTDAQKAIEEAQSILSQGFNRNEMRANASKRKHKDNI